jgi:hypothetical protein
MSPDEAKKLLVGDGVVYWPTREDGEVVRVTDSYVFVRFDIGATAKACMPRDLMKL